VVLVRQHLLVLLAVQVAVEPRTAVAVVTVAQEQRVKVMQVVMV
jgi:hypothetical protein